MTTKNTFLTGSSALAVPPEPGFVAPSAAFIAFGRDPHLIEWWTARHGAQRIPTGTPRWAGRMLDTMLTPATSGVVPTYAASGGPDNEPYVQGYNLSPARPLVSEAGKIVVPNGGDWTLGWVGKASSGSTGTPINVVGGGAGGGVLIQARSSDFVRVHTRDPSGVVTQRLSVAAATAANHMGFVSYRASTGEMQVWIDNAVGVGTPTISGLSLSPHSGRISTLGEYHETSGVVATANGNAVTDIMVWDIALHTDADRRARLRAIMAETYPTSLTLAA